MLSQADNTATENTNHARRHSNFVARLTELKNQLGSKRQLSIEQRNAEAARQDRLWEKIAKGAIETEPYREELNQENWMQTPRPGQATVARMLVIAEKKAEARKVGGREKATCQSQRTNEVRF